MRFDQHPWVKRIKQEADERKAWAEANPDMAHDWDEAAAIDEAWQELRRKAQAEAAYLEDLPECLEKVGCPFRAVSMLAKGIDTVALGAVQVFLEDQSASFLLLHGPPGKGKTVAACAFLKGVGVGREGALTMADTLKRMGQFWTAAALAVLPAFGDEASERWTSLCKVPNLVLDDLGVETPTDWWRGRLDALIDVRYSGRGLRTVITTNLGVEQFKKQYGERIARRIRETGHVKGIA